MTNLTKRESCYFIITSLIAIGLLVFTIWALDKPNCWDQYHTENQAIQACENHE